MNFAKFLRRPEAIYCFVIISQFVIFKLLSYSFAETIGFDKWALFSRPPVSSLIKPGHRTSVKGYSYPRYSSWIENCTLITETEITFYIHSYSQKTSEFLRLKVIESFEMEVQVSHTFFCFRNLMQLAAEFFSTNILFPYRFFCLNRY